ncbi:MAG: EAL domain-containing protein, partial [bacterium]|nr:EAL domain-containing protein [bacterium]
FELHSIDLQQNKERSLELIQKLSPLGCSFSIDRLDPMSSWNLKELAQHNVRYIKIEAPLLLKVLDSDNAEKKFREFKAKADRLKIDVVISKVEEEKDLLQFLDYNFDYGQGYLFGTPQLSSA